MSRAFRSELVLEEVPLACGAACVSVPLFKADFSTLVVPKFPAEVPEDVKMCLKIRKPSKD